MSKQLEYYASLDYPVMIRAIPIDQGGGYVATIPSLGSQAFVGDGETPQEAYKNLQAAKREIFEEYLHEGLPIPEPPSEHELGEYSGKFVIRMPRELHARLAHAALENDVSLNQYAVYALSSFQSGQDSISQMREIVASTRTAIWQDEPERKVMQDRYYVRSSSLLIKPEFLKEAEHEKVA